MHHNTFCIKKRSTYLPDFTWVCVCVRVCVHACVCTERTLRGHRPLRYIRHQILYNTYYIFSLAWFPKPFLKKVMILKYHTFSWDACNEKIAVSTADSIPPIASLGWTRDGKAIVLSIAPSACRSACQSSPKLSSLRIVLRFPPSFRFFIYLFIC